MGLKAAKPSIAIWAAVTAAVAAAMCAAASLLGRPPVLSLASALLGAAACSIPQSACALISHRHDSIKGTAGLALYDGIYAIALKYMIMIFLFICIFKFGKIDNLIFILSFVFTEICGAGLHIYIFIRKDNY